MDRLCWVQQEEATQKTFFPSPDEPPDNIVAGRKQEKSKKLFTKGSNDNYYSEVYPKEGRWAPSFKFGPRESTLGNLPDDESIYPVGTWFKQLLSNGVERIVLNSLLIRRASPPGQGRGFRPDGSNLPWVVAALEEANPSRLQEWVAHVRTALPDLEDVRTVVRPDDRHRYLVLVYRGGLEVPSWMASDGTLRLLALTLPAYLEDFRGIYLIEEPENGIHPRAVATMYQSLSSVYDAQILMATHSPVILSAVEPADVLCFAKTPEGATDVVVGSEHPTLRDWRGEENLGCAFCGRGTWMTGLAPETDLLILAADGQMEFAIKGLLTRGEAIGFREPSVDIRVHPARDPGCLLRGHVFLRPFYRQYRYAIVMLDRDGCGQESSREALETDLEQRLSLSGWGNRAAAIVLDPELEIWVWSDSPEVANVLGWAGRTPRLAEWLRAEGYSGTSRAKPDRPKEAMEKALRLARKSRSSSIFFQLAQRVSVNRCTDPAFLKFKTILQQWFPRAAGP